MVEYNEGEGEAVMEGVVEERASFGQCTLKWAESSVRWKSGGVVARVP